MFGRCRQKARVLKATLSNTRPKNWMNHFGLRGCQEHHEMFVEDFTLKRSHKRALTDRLRGR